MINYIQKLKNYKVQTIISYTLLSVFSTVLVFFIIYNANWLLGDDVQFFQTTAVGKIFPITMDWGLGRFIPLAYMDLNILTIIPGGNTAFAHYLLAALSFLVFIVFSIILYKQIIKDAIAENKYFPWFVSLCVIALSLKIYVLFLDVPFIDRIICVLITIFMLSYFYFNKTNNLFYGLFSLLIAIYISYCKETISGCLLVFALTNLIFNYKGLSKNQKIFHYLLIINFITFLLLYYFIIYQNTIVFYNQQIVYQSLSIIEVIIYVLGCHKILFFPFLLFLARIYFVIIKHDKKHIFYDGLLFSGIAYASIMVLLHLYYDHYYFVSVLLCVPPLIYFSLKILKNEKIILIALIISIMVSSIYVVRYTKKNQESRTSNWSGISRLTNYISNGYKITWFDIKPIDFKDSVNTVAFDRERSIIERFIDYKLNNNIPYKLKNVSFLDTVCDNNIVLYSSLSLKGNFNEFVHRNNLILLDSFSDITVYGFKK